MKYFLWIEQMAFVAFSLVEGILHGARSTEESHRKKYPKTEA